VSYRFRRGQRLGAADVAATLKSRHIKRRDRLTLYCRANQLSFARLALIVPKKFVPSAVQRNRIRRLVRETFRLHQAQLAGLDCVVRLTKPIGLEAVQGEELRLLLVRSET
jgi:ribonuclease P protein component